MLDETFVVQSTGHHPMETRSAMAYWQNGKLYMHASTQSVQRTVQNVARWVGIPAVGRRADLRVHGRRVRQQGSGGAVSMAIPALLSSKAGAPVMMRHQPRGGELHRPRAADMTGRVKMGFRKDGRITALDLYIVQDSGAYRRRWAITARPAMPPR